MSLFIGVIHCSVGSILGIKTELNYGEKKHAYFERLPVMLFQVFFAIALLGLVMGKMIMVYIGAAVIVIIHSDDGDRSGRSHGSGACAILCEQPDILP